MAKPVAAVLLLSVLTPLYAGAQASTAGKPDGDNKLAILERFVGEWTLDGKWDSGKELRARAVYEWGLGKR